MGKQISIWDPGEENSRYVLNKCTNIKPVVMAISDRITYIAIGYSYLILTYNIWAIQPLLTQSKWNMGEILPFSLIYVMYLHHKFFYWNPSMPKEGNFYYWICNFGKKMWKWIMTFHSAHGGIAKIFFLDHFSPTFLGQKLYFWIQIPLWG